jgi:putative endonuclease
MQEELCPAVYIINNKRNGTLYIGVTSALYYRIWDHKNGTNSGFSRQYGLGMLVWFEHHPSMPSAIHREKRLKKWPRAWKLNLVNAMNPDWQDLHEHIDATINLVEEFASRKAVAK